MFYIISPVSLEILQRFKPPVKDKYGNPDYQLFYDSGDGKEFLSISPLLIDRISNKKDLIEEIARDINWLSLCYDCPLFLYVLSDKYYYKTFALQYASYRNTGKIHEMQRITAMEGVNSPHVHEFRVDKSYFNSDYTVTYNAVMNVVQGLSLKQKEVYEFHLTIDGFVERCVDV